MHLSELSQRACTIRQHYALLEQERYGQAWTCEDIAMGFVGDVGDMMKLVMAQKGIRAIPDASARLAHELADCLWSLLVLADQYGIDMERAFLQTMDQLEQQITQERGQQ